MKNFRIRISPHYFKGKSKETNGTKKIYSVFFFKKRNETRLDHVTFHILSAMLITTRILFKYKLFSLLLPLTTNKKKTKQL